MSLKNRILLIEDEKESTQLIEMHGALAGYYIQVETNVNKAHEIIEKNPPDLILLSANLAGNTGLDFCPKIKALPTTKNIPLIVLSNRGEEFDVVLGIEIGADDYIVKPFSLKILFARIKALLRISRQIHSDNRVLRFGEFSLDIERYVVRKNQEVIALTLSEFGILRRLITNRGQVLSRSNLIDDIQDQPTAAIVDRNIDVHIASLRKKGPTFHWIETVRGIGYRFREETDIPKSNFLEAPHLFGQRSNAQIHEGQTP